MKHVMVFSCCFFCLVVSSQEKREFFDWEFENTSELTNGPSAAIVAQTEAVRDSSERQPLFFIFLTHEGGGELKIGLLDEDILQLILINIVEKNKVKIAKFGTFTLRQKKQRIGRNPKTRESKVISKRNVILFKPSKDFKKYINNNE